MVRAAAAPTQDTRIVMTYEEFLAYGAETTHAEWVDGEVIVFMPPRLRHQHLLAFLLELLSRFCRPGNLGVVIVAPFEMRLGQDGPAREPDVLFVAQQHLDRLDDRRLDGPADLVIVLVSDSSTKLDRDDKNAAANQLRAFTKQVEAFHKTNKLTTAQAQSMLDKVRNVTDQLK